MKTELLVLTLVSTFTAVMWVPYVLDRMRAWGIWATLDNPPADPQPLAPWAERAKRAHANAVENLVVFGALVLAVVAAGAEGPLTAGAAWTYLVVRVLHFVLYAAGVPVVRTLAFVVGCACQLALAWALLA